MTTSETFGHSLTFRDSSSQLSDCSCGGSGTSTLTITNSNFSHNTGSSFSGVFIQYTTSASNVIMILLDLCHISENQGGQGAGLHISFPYAFSDIKNNPVTITDTTIEYNRVMDEIEDQVHGAVNLYNAQSLMKYSIICSLV